MSLPSGTQLGVYTITGLVGEGGMGQVYRARDPRLERDVALKTLPASFSTDPERLRRFELEARATASLNHPNILVVFDIGSHEGAPYVVSELLEGETLRAKLAGFGGEEPSGHARSEAPQPKASGGGAPRALRNDGLPVRRALDFASQIARGLAAAHEKGVVHRDLKPENLFVTTEGRVKILDFGLAKLAGPEAGAGPAETTMAGFQTSPGMVLGTMGYMAPEQVRGMPVDHRADIFSFGAVLYEMLSGHRAFHGATAADTIAAIVKGNTPDLPLAERHIPPSLARIVERCLEKAPVARFQTASDLAFALESLSGSSDRSEIGSAATAIAPPAAAPAKSSTARVAWIAAATFAAALAGTGAVALRHLREVPAPATPLRFTISPSENGVLAPTSPPVVSPDGQKIVFGMTVNGVTTLRLRAIASLDFETLAGTEGASYPFWSPDSKSVAFFSGGKLRTTPISRGSPLEVCDAASVGGGTWAPDNTILFAPDYGPMQTVPATGGTPAPATTLGEGERGHRWPWFLPDGRHFLYIAIAGPGTPTGTVWMGSIGSNERASLGSSDSDVQYAAGYLLSSVNRSLVAQRFDAGKGQKLGEPIIVQPLTPFAASFRAGFSVSESGVLSTARYLATLETTLTWFDRSGTRLGAVGEPGVHINLAISPDDRRLAVSRNAASLGNIDIWLADLTPGGRFSRLTSDPAPEFDPAWSPDGTAVAFISPREKRYDLYRRFLSGNAEDVLVARPPGGASGVAWGRGFIVFTSANDLWTVLVSGQQADQPAPPTQFLTTPFGESDPASSPDDRWLAYSSNESGRNEVHVQSFPVAGGKHVVSSGGGREPLWRGDGKELFYLGLDGTLKAATIDTTPEFRVVREESLFKTGIIGTQNNHPYAVTHDGKRFLIPVSASTSVDQVTVVVNWTSDLGK